MLRRRLLTLLCGLGLGVLLLIPTTMPAAAATRYTFGTLSITGGRAGGSVTFYSEDETRASIWVSDVCPGNGQWVSAEVQIRKFADDQEMAYVSTQGHRCGYGASEQEFVEAYYFDHQAARLRLCRYYTGSYDPISCVYTRWYDNPYDD